MNKPHWSALFCRLPLACLAALSLQSCALLAAGPRDILIEDRNVFPESMSAASDGTIFIGSIKGTVFRARPGSVKARAWIKRTPENGILSLLGVLVDEPAATLWLCSAPTAMLAPPVTGAAAILAFDIRTGSLRGTYPLPPPQPVCNDMTVARDGALYVSDTPNGRVLKLARGGQALEPYAQDARLQGIDGIVFGGDGTLYVNNISRGQLLRIDHNPDGTAGQIVQLSTSQPLMTPDGFRLIGGNRFLLSEGMAGRIDEVTIIGDYVQVQVLKQGLQYASAVTHVGDTAYGLEGKIGYLIDPHLKGQDPGEFKVYAIPLL